MTSTYNQPDHVDALVEKPATCDGCPLYPQRRIQSLGHATSKIIFVGDHPTKSLYGGNPFQDRPGNVINAALQRLQTEYRELDDGPGRWANLPCYKTYGVNCVTDDRPPKEAVERCRQYLDIAIVENEPAVLEHVLREKREVHGELKAREH